jgi:hypothetical protein
MSAPHGLVDEHFAGRGTAASDREMWRHLPGCERCRGRYRALSLLESLEPDGGERARGRMARAVFAPAPRRRAAVWGGAALAAAAALVPLVALPRDRFQPRGGPETADATRPSLSIYRVPANGPPERVGAVVRAGDSLAFSYLNPPETRATHLLIFAVDDAARVYWFWPAWTSAAADPVALAIQPATAPVELAEAVRHPMRPGRLAIHALFARRPYHVREIEAAVAGQWLTGLDGVLVSQPLEVLP